jgi:hypothetical protein
MGELLEHRLYDRLETRPETRTVFGECPILAAPCDLLPWRLTKKSGQFQKQTGASKFDCSSHALQQSEYGKRSGGIKQKGARSRGKELPPCPFSA